MQKNRPKVTVIIPTYQRNVVLKKVLNTIDSQIFSKDTIETIIVDDASNVPVIDDINPKDFSFSISIIRQQKNKGQAAARNAGIKKARGKYLLFLDDDIIPDENLIEEHIKFHKSCNKPQIAVVGKVTWDKSLTITPVMYFLENGGPLCAYNSFKNNDRLSSFYVGNLSIRKDFLIQHGLFDESFTEYGWEDSELGYRLMGKGLFIYLNKNACGQHYKVMNTQDMINRQYKCGQTVLTFYNKYPDAFPYITDLQGIIEALKFESESNLDKVLERIKKLENEYTPSFSCNHRIIPKLWKEYDRLCIYYFNSGLLYKLQSLNHDFKNALDFCDKGVNAFINKDWQQSVKFFDKAKYIYPGFYAIRWYLISSLIKGADKIKAIDELKELISMFPNALWSIYTLGSLLKSEGHRKEAEKYFKTVIRETGEIIAQKNIKAGAHYHLGEIYQEQDRTKEAKENFENCVALNPQHNRAINSLSRH